MTDAMRWRDLRQITFVRFDSLSLVGHGQEQMLDRDTHPRFHRSLIESTVRKITERDEMMGGWSSGPVSHWSSRLTNRDGCWRMHFSNSSIHCQWNNVDSSYLACWSEERKKHGVVITSSSFSFDDYHSCLVSLINVQMIISMTK